MRALVLYERQGNIAHITLNSPDTGNAIDDALAEALRLACRQAIEDEAARVVVLDAAGAAFSLGAAAMNNPAVDIPRRRVAGAIAAIQQPVIAVVQGDAIGQGLELALACDLRLAADTAHFALDQVRHGQFPWDGGTQRLPRVVAKGLALEMLLTGQTVSAAEALDMALVIRCVPKAELAAQAQQLAEKMAAMAPIAAAYAKEAVLKGVDMTIEQGARLEADLAILLHSTHDRAEGLRSFLEKRKPRFDGR